MANLLTTSRACLDLEQPVSARRSHALYLNLSAEMMRWSSDCLGWCVSGASDIPLGKEGVFGPVVDFRLCGEAASPSGDC